MADRVAATFGLMAEDFIKAFQPSRARRGVEATAIYLDVGEEGRAGGAGVHDLPQGRGVRHPAHRQARSAATRTSSATRRSAGGRRFSEAAYVPVPGQPRREPEDGARITRGRIKVAITPVLDLDPGQADLRRVPFLLAGGSSARSASRSSTPSRCRTCSSTGGAARGGGAGLPERAVRIGRHLDVAGWIVPVLIERRGVIYLDVTWISAVTGTALFSRRQPLVAAAAAEEQRFPWEPRAED